MRFSCLERGESASNDKCVFLKTFYEFGPKSLCERRFCVKLYIAVTLGVFKIIGERRSRIGRLPFIYNMLCSLSSLEIHCFQRIKMQHIWIWAPPLSIICFPTPIAVIGLKFRNTSKLISLTVFAVYYLIRSWACF